MGIRKSWFRQGDRERELREVAGVHVGRKFGGGVDATSVEDERRTWSGRE